MTEIAEGPGARADAGAVIRESYSFACMRCGYGWEQSYEIEHHKHTDGHDVVCYLANGRIVPSPLSRPTCLRCDGHVVRIMRPGRVTTALDAAHIEPGDRHWQLADLMHPFRRKE
ncbi:hypothetical protein ACFP51_02385 [Streptomyces pratens]|uniref:C2H2-type domain-containing protein n=1 Tax=Streptomyces pratens TaxID=887456 RepID=A0ABW1M3L6_9ACTN